MSRLPSFIFILYLCLAIFSWLGSVYAWGNMQNMLSADGLRWMVAMVLENVKHSPVIEVLLGTMTLSTLTESGFLPVCLSLFRINKTLSLKKKRAFQISMVVLVLILILIALMVFLPGAVLLSAFGTYQGSAIEMGHFTLVLIVLMCVGMTYGYASGSFSNSSDTIRAIVYLPARIASYFVTLFMASQFIGSLHFVFGERMYDMLFEVGGVNFSWHTVFGIIFYLIPLVIHILDAYKGELRVES